MVGGPIYKCFNPLSLFLFGVVYYLFLLLGGKEI